MKQAGMLLKQNAAGAIRAHAVDQATLDQMLEAGEIEIRRGTPTVYHMRVPIAPLSKVVTEDADIEDDISSYDTKVMTASRRQQSRRR